MSVYWVMPLHSPLAHAPINLPWLGVRDGDVVEWCRPADRWHVPGHFLTGGRRWQFAHLRPLPGDLANRLDTDSRLASFVQKLGAPFFDPETLLHAQKVRN